MRKWLAGVLAAAMCFVGGTALAECAHENISSHVFEAFQRYEQTSSAEEHVFIYDECKSIFCIDCRDYHVNELLQEGVRINEAHDFNEDGVCWRCGYGTDCTHPNTMEHEHDSYYRGQSIGDAKQHLCIGGKYKHTTCLDCPTTLSYEIIDRNAQWYADHEWYEDGICIDCGQVNTCLHENIVDRECTTNIVYTDNGDSLAHTRQDTYYTLQECTDCGEELYRSEITTKESIENHFWNGGVCWACEYTCQHGETTSSEYYNNYRDEQIGDLLNHKYAWDVYVITDCSLCYQRLSDAYSHTDGILYQHNWNDADLCSSCGQENTCTHENADVWTSNENWRYEQIGSNTEHNEIFDSFEITDCSDCGQYKRIAMGTTWRSGRHAWNDEEGICYDCGQENTCPHEDRRSQIWGRNHEWTQIGSSLEHQLTYDKYEVEICNVCDMIVMESHLDTIVENEEHFWNEENKCWTCGQENACQHDGETQSHTENDNYRYESTGDPRWHQYAYDVYRVVECAGCGVELSRTFESTDGWNSSHSWRDDSVCSDCGQKNTCAHEDVTENTYPSDDVYTEVDEETHLHAFTMNIRKRCQICYLKLEERIVGRYEAEEKHVWDDEGICWECGAENACAHANTREQEDIKRKIRTDLGDGLHHSVVEEVRHYTYCDDCQRRISDYSEETREYTEEHTSKYRCWKCDFETECPHEGETDQAVDWIDLRYVPLDENRHEVYGRTETHIYCRDCDEELSVTQSEEQELLETWSHDWDDENVCDDCGYENLNPCTHENTDVKLQQTYGSGWIAQNDAMHVETVIYKEVSICADCGKTLGEISALKKVTKTEAHDFEDGKCWECGYSNPCAHDGTTHTVTEVWDWWEVVCIDDETHKFDAEGAIITYCDLCGDNIAEEKLERQWITKEHEMWIDRCEYCDYRSECAHENTVRKLLPDSDYLYCESISDNAHAATYILHAYDYCEDCDTLLEFENESSEVGMTKVNEPHNMVNHCCVECGYCEHPAEMVETTNKYLGNEYIKYDEIMHEYRIQYTYTSTCTICGEVVKEWTDTGYFFMTQHSYDDDGICYGCGYVNTCKHENAYRVMTTGTDVGYVNIDDPVQHKEISQYYSIMCCPDCGIEWERQLSGVEKEELDKHAFSKRTGECYQCGYVNPCTHNNRELRQSEGEFNRVYIDEEYHAVYQIGWYEWEKCLDCGLIFEEKDVECDPILISAKEEHDFAIRDVCSCGYANSCKHENTVVGRSGTGSYYMQCDDTHHEEVSIIGKAVFCADCGKELSLIDEKEEILTYDQHRYNQFGVCQYCNYVNQCKHKETQKLRAYGLHGVKIIDDFSHEISHEIYEEEICLSCGESLGIEIIEDVIEQQEHNGNDYCSICGWGTGHVCEWNATKNRVLYSAKAIDSLTHEAVVQFGSSWYCDECGNGRSGIPQPIETITEAHNFTDLGRCEDCGYVNFCEHEETYETHRFEWKPNYLAKDENEHTCSGVMWTETRCVACDQRLSYTAELNAERTEEHIFDNVADLICDLCGYEKEAPEEAPTPEPTPEATPEPEETPEPDETEEPDATPKPTQKPGGGSGSTEKPGFYVTVKSDKKHYAPDETAMLTITLRNTTGKRVENVRIEHLLPDGLQYAPQQDMSMFEPFTVEANTTVKRVVYVKVMGAGLPQTGDDSNLMIWLALAVVSAAAVAALRAKRKKG